MVNDEDNNLNIVLVEEIAARSELIRQAIERTRTECTLHTVGAGQNTLQYLRRAGPYSAAPAPELILFDISDCERGRLKIMEQVQSLASLREIPLVLLTCPDSEKLIEEKYSDQSGGNMFSAIELDSFLRAMRFRTPQRFLGAVSLIQQLGFVLVRLPGEIVAIQASRSNAASC